VIGHYNINVIGYFYTTVLIPRQLLKITEVTIKAVAFGTCDFGNTFNKLKS